jgi:hypothetical protein
MAKIRIGMVGEDPADTSAISNLVADAFPNVQFKPMLKNFTGNMLESRSAMRFLKNEFESVKPKAVILIRDLDGIASQKEKKTVREHFFQTCQRQVNNKGIPLLNIYSIEALVYADIETFKSQYKVDMRFKGDPTMVKDPKKELKRATRKSRRQYHENQNPALFSKLNLTTVRANCGYFNEFMEKLAAVAK